MLFFSQAISSIHSNYPTIFIQESEDLEEEEPEDNEVSNKGTGNPLEQFGITVLVLTLCERTNTSFEEIMTWSICQTFYLTSLVITMNKMKEQEIRKWKMTH